MDNNIEKFFTGKYFRIPNYQRDYSWDTTNVDDLFEDILEAIETKTSHYIGTFILASGSKSGEFNVVDGQQRLTTLIMLFNAVIEKLSNETEQIINKDKFVRSQTDPNHPWKLELLNLLETTDFRVYKMRGTNPRVDMSTLARDAKRLSPSEIEGVLILFVQRFMGDEEFIRYLKNTFHNTPTAHLMIEYGEKINKKPYSIAELHAMKATQPTVEHIFPQQERFEFPNLGFRDIDDYKHMVQTIGNLTILEKTLNSQCQNRTPDQKVSGGYYERSLFEDARRISAQLKNSGMPFTRNDIQKRTKILSEFCVQRWRV